MSRPICLLTVASLALAGCNMATKQDDTAQYDDTRNPHYQQAQQDLDNGKPDAAALEYETALEANPKLSGAQFQLGILYGEKLQDPVSSIYHLKRFLELAPNSDHAANAKQMIEKEGQAFAASVATSSTPNTDSARIQADNIALQQKVDEATHTIAQLQAQLAKAKRHHDTAAAIPLESPVTPNPPVPEGAPAPDATTPTPGSATTANTNTASAPTPPAPTGPLKALPLDAPNPALEGTNAAPGATPDPNAPPARSYTVVKGDSLWKIAHKMYPGDTKNGVEKIQDANKDAIGGKPLKIGQVLVIP